MMPRQDQDAEVYPLQMLECVIIREENASDHPISPFLSANTRIDTPRVLC